MGSPKRYICNRYYMYRDLTVLAPHVPSLYLDLPRYDHAIPQRCIPLSPGRQVAAENAPQVLLVGAGKPVSQGPRGGEGGNKATSREAGRLRGDTVQ